MSGIAAIIRFDGGEVEPGAIERITAAIGYRGPDGIAHWRRGPVALGHCMLRTTAESLEEVQPLANEDESLVLVMDGWLGNWEELRADLLARGARLRTRSDAEMVLRAYETWGEDCPRHIDGEFAFVIWNARHQTAFCASDHIGLKPLYYHWDGRQLVVASDIVGVLAGPGVSKAPNLPAIAERMVGASFTSDETIWRSVMRLKPACWQRFGRNGTVSDRYWSPTLDRTLRYRRDQDYADHYREVFADSVRRASRTHLPLACEVSGGLDSSAVFAMAHRLRREGLLGTPAIFGYTHRLAEGDTHADEIGYARAVARHVGAIVREVPQTLPGRAWCEARALADCDLAPVPIEALAGRLCEAAAEDGCRVVLTGMGGDEWLEGSRYYYAELLRAGDVFGLIRALARDAREVGPVRAAGWSAKYGISDLLPRRLHDLIFDKSKNVDRIDFEQCDWLAPSLRALLRERYLFDLKSRNGTKHPAKGNFLRILYDLHNWIGPRHCARNYARHQMQDRAPMCSRPFMDFVFALPEVQRLRGMTTKYVHREAMRDLIPDAVAGRLDKGEYSVTFTRLLDDIDDLVRSEPQANAAGILQRDGLEALYNKYLERRAGRPTWQLWGIFASTCALQIAASSDEAGQAEEF